MRKQIQLICDKCNNLYFKDLSEHKRNSKLRRKNYCSLSCSANINKIPINKRNIYNISKHCKNQIDKWTNFRFYIKLMNNHKQNVSVTLDDLEEIWNKQKGICPYTNIFLTLSTHSSKDPIFYKRASIDRIDSSKPYEKDNIEFVSLAINFMKNKYSKQDTIDFINIIKK